MRFDIITIFPEIFDSIFSAGIVKKALEKDLLEIRIHNLRDYASDKHKQVDDRPFGGNPGMVFKPEPIFHAVEAVKEKKSAQIILLSPQGRRFDHHLAESLARCPQMVLICGRYEGVDERVVQNLVTEDISVGDYILSGGESAAVVVIDAVARYIPDVVGKIDSVKDDSFQKGLLDHPHYTRPREFRGMKVPDVLFSGDHKKIEFWRRKKALEKTWRLRPDLLKNGELSPEDKEILSQIRMEIKGKNDESD